MKARDHQVSGNHYLQMAIQPFELTLANDLGGVEHTIIKYVSRWPDKGGIDDVRKARHTLDFLIEDAEELIALRTPRRWITARVTAHQYCTANQLPKLESEVVRHICFWSHNQEVRELHCCAEVLDQILADHTPEKPA